MRISNRTKPYLIWICAAIFYVYQFVLRVSPSLIVDDLMIFFQLNASGVASLSALSMYSYALMQIPAGLLVDSFGVRKILLVSLVLCLSGVSIFTGSHSLILAKLGRLLIGTGSASAFLCVGKISTLWFPSKRRATLLGMTMSMGTVGASLGSTGLSFLIAHLGWKMSLLWTHSLGLLTLMIGYLTIPDSATETELTGNSVPSRVQIFQQLLNLIKNWQIWLYSLTALGIYLCISVIADLWGVSFLVRALGMDKLAATQTVSLMYVGLCFGSLFLTFIGDFFHCKQLLIKLSLGLLLPCAAVLIYYPYLPKATLSILFFMIGFLGGAEMLCFANLCDLVGKKASGTATGFMNCIVMLGGAFVSEQVGKLLDFFWQGNFHSSGIRFYSAREYQLSLSPVVAILLAATLISMLLPKKTITQPD